MPAPRRLFAAAVGAALVAAPALVIAAPAVADHTDTPTRVTLMGSLMDELGCADDWSETCEATDLLPVAGSPSLFARTFTVPKGSYEYKVRLNGSWTENYGDATFGIGGNIPLAIDQSTELRFTYDHETHRVAVGPVEPAGALTGADRAMAGDSLREDLTRENFYFVMADRFENGDPSNDTAFIEGTRLEHGFDPKDQGFFHGGDLKGIIERLDYIEDLGTTAIWMTPSFKNKPVQGEPGSESAGYHGYWITDFTQIDPHLGTNAELKTLIDLAHERGMKVFFDIITNHTADVLDYPESAYDATGQVPYQTKEAVPYKDAAGNEFDDRDFTFIGDPFPEVDPEVSFPYEPTFRDPADAQVKVPEWLNDPTMYHNRGTSTFSGENSEYGDFPSGNRSALDDLWTERPQVVEGMIDIYKTWVEDAGVDGFRIDTVKHVNMDFWKQFGPALQGHAASVGNDDFFMFGEVYDADPRFMSQYTTEGRLQATVDFGFQGSGVNFAKGKPTTELRDFYALDDYFTDADSNAYSLPTFLGNHDMGRVGSFLRQGTTWGDAELVDRDELAHSLMYLTRGQPVVYYGDEQGFSAPPDVPGGIGDQRAREDMFASQVKLHNTTYDLIGTKATTADENFDTKHPLFRHIADLAQLREKHPALADGAQVHRYSTSGAGIFAFSRMDATEQVEYVVAVNNSDTAETATFDTYQPARSMLKGVWPATAQKNLKTDAEGRVTVTVPALSAVVYRANAKLRPDNDSPTPVFTTPGATGIVSGRAEVGVSLPGGDFTQVTFAWRPVGTQEWQLLGTDDNAPYRAFHDTRTVAQGTPIEYRAIARDHDGDFGVVSTSAVVGQPQPPVSGGIELGPITQPDAVSVPGSHGSEIGCAADWDPPCDNIQLTLDQEGQVWTGTFKPQAGQYAFKAAINRSWEENYGAGGNRNGSDIPYTADGTDVSFYFDYRTKWVTNTRLDPILVATGDFQAELGCTTDNDVTCMRSWLQDPDGDGTYAFSTIDIPAGSYSVSVGETGPVSFTVEEGLATTIAFQAESKALTVDTFAPDFGPDLSSERASWLTPEVISWNLPDVRGAWTYRLHWGPAGSLVLDAETVGGSSIPLSLDPAGLPAALASKYPDLDGDEVLRLSRKDARDAARIAGAGQLAVVAYDELGAVVQATGVAVVGDIG